MKDKSPQDMLLNDAVAVVTGASQGIGAAIAKVFAEQGAQVICVGRTTETLHTFCDDINSVGYTGFVYPFVADVTQSASRQNLVEYCIKTFNRITHLVNTVGGGPMRDLDSLSENELDDLFHYNVTSAYHLIQLCAPHLKKSGQGNIINISSAAGKLVQKHFSGYAAVKTGLNHMTRNLAQELAPEIRLNAIAPGPISTPALTNFVPQSIQDTMAHKTPLKRIGTAEDIAQAALFLASSQSAWITGQILAVDGGAESSVMP